MPNCNAAVDLRPGERNELEVSTVLIRRFLGIAEDEFIELTAFVNGKAWVAQCNTYEQHVDLLRRAHDIRGFAGSYMLVNGPLDPTLSSRYEQNRWQPANNKRAMDRDIQSRRAIFIDVDPVRPSGISATNDEQRAAWEVGNAIQEDLAKRIGRTPIGWTSSGNGFAILVAIEPAPNTPELKDLIARGLKALSKKYSTERVSIDGSVFNAARLMSCPGTWKRKGRHTDERPHRMTSFSCALNPTTGEADRVPLTELF
jgi:hypothetical protein